eukprot:7788077-Pyramimonas_sp.AAC.1
MQRARRAGRGRGGRKAEAAKRKVSRDAAQALAKRTKEQQKRARQDKKNERAAAKAAAKAAKAAAAEARAKKKAKALDRKRRQSAGEEVSSDSGDNMPPPWVEDASLLHRYPVIEVPPIYSPILADPDLNDPAKYLVALTRTMVRRLSQLERQGLLLFSLNRGPIDLGSVCSGSDSPVLVMRALIT